MITHSPQKVGAASGTPARNPHRHRSAHQAVGDRCGTSGDSPGLVAPRRRSRGRRTAACKVTRGTRQTRAMSHALNTATRPHAAAPASGSPTYSYGIRKWREEGLSFPAIAARLNAEGHRTRRDRPWNVTRVRRVLDRTGTA